MHQQCLIAAANIHRTDNEALSLWCEKAKYAGGDDDSSIFSDLCVDDLSDDCWHTLEACSYEAALKSNNIRPLSRDDDDDFEPISLNSWNFDDLTAVAPSQYTASEMSERGLSLATNGFTSIAMPALTDSWADKLGQRLAKTSQSSQETRAALSRQVTCVGRHSFMVTPTSMVQNHFHSTALSGTASIRSPRTIEFHSEGAKTVSTEHPYESSLVAPAKRASVAFCGTTQTSHTTMDSIRTPLAHSVLHYPQYPHNSKSKKPVKWKSSAQSRQILHQIHALSMQTKQSLLRESKTISPSRKQHRIVAGIVPKDGTRCYYQWSGGTIRPPQSPCFHEAQPKLTSRACGIDSSSPPGCYNLKDTAL
jgi:hypothetical protein